jgi:hypothetical protein
MRGTGGPGPKNPKLWLRAGGTDGLGFDPRAEGVERRLPKGAENAKGRGKGGLDEGVENDPYCIRKKIFRWKSGTPAGPAAAWISC